jgi:ribosomal protein L21
MLYSHRRLNLLERSLIEHGKILQNFIINYNIQMQSINSLYINKNKQEGQHIKKINLGEKISVCEDECSEYVGGADVNNELVQHEDDDKVNVSSEDEDDDDDDDDDDDADDDDDDDADADDDDDDDDEDDDDDNEDDDEKDDEKDDEDDEDDDVENGKEDDDKVLTISKSELENNIKDLGDFEEIDLNKPFFSNNDDETFIKNLPINLDTFNIDLNTNSKIINLNNLDQDTNVDTNVDANSSNNTNTHRKNYSKMKVDDLKTIAVTRNLIDNETAQKTKKADLIKILQNA